MNTFGHLELILGPMFSGKSTELMRKVKRYQFANKKCLVINYANDNRYSDENYVSTHDKLKIKAYKLHRLQEISNLVDNFDVIAIDEGQFFPDIVEECEELCNLGKIVIVAALDGTFQRKPFGSVLNLIPLAEYIQKLSAVCVGCGKDAFFTKRITDCEDIELIGGEESYKPVCRKCFHEKKERKNSEKSDSPKSNKDIFEIEEIEKKY